MIRLISGLAAVCLFVLPAKAVVLGQVDTFQFGGNGWRGSGQSSVVPGGGPSGDADSFFQVTSDANGRLAANGGRLWIGGVDYLTPGVTSISVDLRNFGTSALHLRVFLYTGQANGSYTSTNAFLVPADGQWHHTIFGLTAQDLTWVGTGVQGNLNHTLMNVKDLSVRHQSGPASPLDTPIAGSFGIDNVAAMPEPSSLAGLLLSAIWRIKRRQRNVD